MKAPDAKRESQLLCADEAFCEATCQSGLDGWMSFFRSDALVFSAQGRIIRGMDAIRDWYERIAFPPAGFRWSPGRAEVSADGDLGATSGCWSIAEEEGDRSARREGRYLSIWKCGSDGQWGILADCGGSRDVRTRYRGLDAPPRRVVWSTTHRGIASSGDLAWQAGHWDASGPMEGRTRETQHGKFLSLWKRRRDGCWKVESEIGFAHD